MRYNDLKHSIYFLSGYDRSFCVRFAIHMKKNVKKSRTACGLRFLVSVTKLYATISSWNVCGHALRETNVKKKKKAVGGVYLIIELLELEKSTARNECCSQLKVEIHNFKITPTRKSQRKSEFLFRISGLTSQLWVQQVTSNQRESWQH